MKELAKLIGQALTTLLIGLFGFSIVAGILRFFFA